MTETSSPHAAMVDWLQSCGLNDLAPGELAEFARMAERVRLQTQSVPRMQHKSDEPAHVFRVPAVGPPAS